MNAVWSAALPPGSGLQVFTRTSPDGTAWSAWSAIAQSGDAIAGPAARFLQYRLDLTGAPDASPIIESISFIYPASARDVVAPVISGSTASPAPTSATIAWITDETATSLVEFGTTAGYGSSASSEGPLTAQHEVLIGGLTENTLYHYRIISRDAAGNQSTSADATFTTPRVEAVVGQWNTAANWPLVAVHAALLHTGDVVLWDAWELPDTPSGRVWNPITDTFTSVPVPGSALFCAGHAMLPDGRLLVIGGHHGAAVGIADTNVFDPVTRTWTRLPNMSVARWYPTALYMCYGRVL
jgi:hypothetical protein